jgi:hypothetical protein
MSDPTQTDWALESFLGERLRDLAADTEEQQAVARLDWPVTTIAPLDELGLPEERQAMARPLALYFGLAGESREASIGEGSAQRWAEDWWVVIGASHPAPKLGAAVNLLRDLAGPLRRRLRIGLGSWTPDRRYWTPLERVPAQAAPVYLIGYAEFPLRFRTLVRESAPHFRNRS